MDMFSRVNPSGAAAPVARRIKRLLRD